MIQDGALEILKTGANVFLTGEPGAGKTHTINEYIRYLRAHRIEVAVTASTGIAATHIGGMTIHSWSGIGIKPKLSKYDLDALATREYVVKRVRRAKVLIIDEVSMLADTMLSMVDAVCRAIRQSEEPFGGLQIILVGDFFQLPPVSRAADAPARFAYESEAWQQANPLVCYLTEQHRQDDAPFLAILSAIRSNTFNATHMPQLEARVVKGEVPAHVPKLFAHNADVDKVNGDILGRLPGDSKTFVMSAQGPAVLVASLKKGCLSPETLCLKKGAVVMFTKNNPKGLFVNGTLGVIEGFNTVTKFPIVTTRVGRKIEVEPMDWALEENGRVRARIRQFPVRLAWAMTVHKSQGVSLDEAVMDLRQVFEFGQGYVALSRVRRLEGLHLLGWNERAFEVHPAVLEQDETFRAASAEAQKTFSVMDSAQKSAMHKRFIKASGGVLKASGQPKQPGSVYFAEIRKTHPNAYRRWDAQQDSRLREMFGQGKKVKELMELFGRKRGAIHSRLVKLGLLEKVV